MSDQRDVGGVAIFLTGAGQQTRKKHVKVSCDTPNFSRL